MTTNVHDGAICDSAFLASGDFVTCGDDGTIRIQPTTGSSRILDGHAARVNQIAVDRRLILSGGDDHTLRLWNADSGQQLWQQRLTEQRVGVVALHEVANFAVTAQGQQIITFDVTTGSKVAELNSSADVTTLVFTASGKNIIVGDATGRHTVLDLRSGQRVHTWDKHSSSILEGRLVKDLRVDNGFVYMSIDSTTGIEFETIPDSW